MSGETGSPYGFELDEFDPRLFRRPQHRKLILKRPGAVDLVLTVALWYEECVFRAKVINAGIHRDDRGKGSLGMSEEKWLAVYQMIDDFYGVKPSPPETASSLKPDPHHPLTSRTPLSSVHEEPPVVRSQTDSRKGT